METQNTRKRYKFGGISIFAKEYELLDGSIGLGCDIY